MSITKAELLRYLNDEGFIEKLAQTQTGFYCSSKVCTKVLTGEIDSFGIQTSRFMLRERLRKHASKKYDGSWDLASDLIARCLICAYRGYRILYKRKFGVYPDEDVLDDFNTNSEAPEVQAPRVQPQIRSQPAAKPRSPPRAAPRSPFNVTRELSSIAIQKIFMPLLKTFKYANEIILGWMALVTRFKEQDFGLTITSRQAVDYGQHTWYLPTEAAWDSFKQANGNLLADNDAYQSILLAHYLKPDGSVNSKTLINAVFGSKEFAAKHPLRVNMSDLKRKGSAFPRDFYEITLESGARAQVQIRVEVIDQVLIPQGLREKGAEEFETMRFVVLKDAIDTMRRLKATHWVQLWELVLKSTRFLQDPDQFPKALVFIVPEEVELQRILKMYIKPGTFDASPGPTNIGWEIFFCGFGTINKEGTEFISLKGHPFSLKIEGGLVQEVDGRRVEARVRSYVKDRSLDILMINGLLSVKELSAKVAKTGFKKN